MSNQKFSKRKDYPRAIFPPEVFEAALLEFGRVISSYDEKLGRTELSYKIDTDQITVKFPDENYRRVAFKTKSFDYSACSDNVSQGLTFYRGMFELTVGVSGVPNLADADAIFSIFDNCYSSYIEPPEDTLKKITVFIGHGRSRSWRDLKDHLQDLHGIDVVAYETGARAGLTIHEVLREMVSKASIAFLVLTAEDIDRDGVAHARENVVHETGLFQGKLGFKRAIVLLEEGCNEFSNIAGLQQLRFAQGNIKEIFGDVLAVVRREFTSSK